MSIAIAYMERAPAIPAESHIYAIDQKKVDVFCTGGQARWKRIPTYIPRCRLAKAEMSNSPIPCFQLFICGCDHSVLRISLTQRPWVGDRQGMVLVSRLGVSLALILIGQH